MQNTSDTPPSRGDSRRSFIKKAATATAAVASTGFLKLPVYGQNQAPSANVAGANNRIVVGYIGVGGQGMAHVRAMKEAASENNIAQAAVCDVSKTRMAEAAQYIGGGCKTFADHRQLIESNDIDAVVIATVDHWHTECSVDALNSGKHVYVEKPMTRYLDEAFLIHDTVKRTGKKLQVGSQGCTDQKYHQAAELIRQGLLGPLVLAQGSYMRNNEKGEWNYTIQDWATAEDIDWQRWLGPVQKKTPFDADPYFRWRKYYPYCSGLLGDLVPHRLHPLMLATANPEFPSRVVSLGQKAIRTDKNTPGTPERDVPESVQLIAEFPSGLSIIVISSSVSEFGLPDVIRGHHARVEFGGDRVDLKPERPFSEEVDPETFENLRPGEDIRHHEKNWLDCIRSGKEPNAGIDLAAKVQTVISLAELSNRLSVACLFDEKSRKVTTQEGREIKPFTYETEPAV
jgi:predicted dehydrogenase